MDSTKLWNEYNRYRTRKAAQHQPAIYKALKGQLQHWADTKQTDTIPIQPLYDALKTLYTDSGRIWAYKIYSDVLKDAKVKEVKAAPIGLNEEFINAILQLFNNRLLILVNDITDTTRDYIRQAVENGINDGKGIDEIVKEILANTDINRMRAERIARTEVGRAANGAEQIGVDKTGLETNKIWISIRDKRTRRDHVTVDNQVVPDGEPFIVGNERYKMLRPGALETTEGQPVPGKETINCRCTVGRKVLRDAKTGLPVRKQGLTILR